VANHLPTELFGECLARLPYVVWRELVVLTAIAFYVPALLLDASDLLGAREQVARLNGRGRVHDAVLVERLDIADEHADSELEFHRRSVTSGAARVEMAVLGVSRRRPDE
jgi:hypothetical protein